MKITKILNINPYMQISREINHITEAIFNVPYQIHKNLKLIHMKRIESGFEERFKKLKLTIAQMGKPQTQ